MTDPALGSAGLGPVEATVRGKVIAPLKRLCAEMEAGAKRSTAFFLARRFVIPNLMYHMQAWGLHADPRLWEEVDGALTEFTGTRLSISTVACKSRATAAKEISGICSTWTSTWGTSSDV